MGGHGDAVAVVAQQQAHHTAGAHHEHAPHHHAGSAHHAHGDAASDDQCNLCVAFCSVTPLASELPTILAPQEASSLRFPGYAAAPPSFVSGGQERPPRSI
jgi:hypothetical protein